MAQMLMDPARDTLWELSISEWDVLERMQRGLIGGEVNLSLAESQWVARRLAELLGWNAEGLFD
jgi:hypothetical protein